MTSRDHTSASSLGDGDLVLRARSGDEYAVLELWRRHRARAVDVAAALSVRSDLDEVVAAAFANVVTAIAVGTAPVGPFRPFLYRAVRATLAERTADQDDASDSVTDDSARLIRDAFDSLPPRWQEVLWYIEVERLGTARTAPLLGASEGATVQLAYRARDGLREAWMGAQLAHAPVDGEHLWTRERAASFARGTLTQRHSARVRSHLQTCSACSEILREADRVAARLATAVLAPIVGASAVVGVTRCFDASSDAPAPAPLPPEVRRAAPTVIATHDSGSQSARPHAVQARRGRTMGGMVAAGVLAAAVVAGAVAITLGGLAGSGGFAGDSALADGTVIDASIEGSEELFDRPAPQPIPDNPVPSEAPQSPGTTSPREAPAPQSDAESPEPDVAPEDDAPDRNAPTDIPEPEPSATETARPQPDESEPAPTPSSLPEESGSPEPTPEPEEPSPAPSPEQTAQPEPPQPTPGPEDELHQSEDDQQLLSPETDHDDEAVPEQPEPSSAPE